MHSGDMIPTDDATIVQFDQEYLDHLVRSEQLETKNLQRTRDRLVIAQESPIQWETVRSCDAEITRSEAELRWLRNRIVEVKRYYVQD